MKNVALIYAKFRKTIKFETNGSTYTFLAFIDFPTAIDFSFCFFAEWFRYRGRAYLFD